MAERRHFTTHIRSPLFEKIRNSELAIIPPASTRDSRNFWTELDATARPTASKRDLDLLGAGTLVSFMTHDVMIEYESLGHFKLSMDDAKRTLVALANLNWDFLSEEFDKDRKATPRLSDTYFTDPFYHPNTGQLLTLDDFNDAAIDTLNRCLQYCSRTEFIDPAPCDAVDESLRITHLQNRIWMLDHVWQRVLWEGYHLTTGARIEVKPNRPELEKKKEAWFQRHHMLTLHSTHAAYRDWHDKRSDRKWRSENRRNTVTGFKRKHGQLCFQTGWAALSTRRAPQHLVDQYIIGRSYLRPYWASKAPDLDLTVQELVTAWYVLRDAADVLAASAAPSGRARRNFARWSIIAPRAELKRVLQICCGFAAASTEQVLDFFSWEPSCYKGLWGAPLVPLTGGDMAMVHSVLLASNPIRRTEIWLEKGWRSAGTRQHERGKLFENGVRESLGDAISANSYLRDAGAYSSAVQIPRVGDVDVLFHVGDMTFVCECKFMMFPAEARERFNCLVTLDKAVDQATHKADYIREHSLELSRQSGLDFLTRSRRIVPAVITNHSYGLGEQPCGCVITDIKTLLIFLSSPNYGMSAYRFGRSDHQSAIVLKLYRDTATCQERIMEFLDNPPTMIHLMQRLTTRDVLILGGTGEEIWEESFSLADSEGVSELPV